MLNRTFHLSPHENILTIARIKTLFVLYNAEISHCFLQNSLLNNLSDNFLNTYEKWRILFVFFLFSASESSKSSKMSDFSTKTSIYKLPPF